MVTFSYLLLWTLSKVIKLTEAGLEFLTWEMIISKMALYSILLMIISKMALYSVLFYSSAQNYFSLNFEGKPSKRILTKMSKPDLH